MLYREISSDSTCGICRAPGFTRKPGWRKGNRAIAMRVWRP